MKALIDIAKQCVNIFYAPSVDVTDEEIHWVYPLHVISGNAVDSHSLHGMEAQLSAAGYPVGTIWTGIFHSTEFHVWARRRT